METYVISANPFKTSKRFNIDAQLRELQHQQTIDRIREEEQELKRNKNKKGGKFYPKKKKSR